MSSQLGPIEVFCDAPPYPVVQACRQIGIRSPEDVRWLRLSALCHSPHGRHQGPWSRSWKMLWGTAGPKAKFCSCGGPQPEPKVVVVMFDTGEQASYILGQCGCCRTVFWDEP